MQAVCALAYARGFRIFDTALVYGNQRILGDALNAIGSSEILVVSKVHQAALAEKGGQACVAQILAELQQSLVDTVLIHAPKNVDHIAAMYALLAEKDAGRIKKVGVSNYTLRHLEHLADNDIVPDVLQIEIHPYLQESALVRYCHENGIEVMGHTAFANGRVFGDSVLAKIAQVQGIDVAELVLCWGTARGITPVISTTCEDRVPHLGDAHDRLPDWVLDRIAQLNSGSRICSDPEWAEFFD